MKEIEDERRKRWLDRSFGDVPTLRR